MSTITGSTEQSRTFSDEDRLMYGGDYSITRTVPARHPKTGRPLPGTRASIRGASRYYRSLLRGDIIWKHDKTKEFSFCWWKDDGSENSRDFFMLLKNEKGFKPCNADDWELSPDLDGIIEVENGLIVIRGNISLLSTGAKQQYEVLMYRTKERMLQEEAALQVAPSRFQEVAAAQAQDRLGNAIGDEKGVTAMPIQMEEIPHHYIPD